MSDESQFHKHVMSIFFVLLKQVYCIKYRFCFVHLNYTVTYSSTTGPRTAVALKLYTYPIHLPNNLFIHYGTADRGST